MAEMSEDQVEACVRAMWMLWGNRVEHTGHEAAARAAGANLMSESGLLDAPREVLQAFTQAIEAGYAVALAEVEAGEHDNLRT